MGNLTFNIYCRSLEVTLCVYLTSWRLSWYWGWGRGQGLIYWQGGTIQKMLRVVKLYALGWYIYSIIISIWRMAIFFIFSQPIKTIVPLVRQRCLIFVLIRDSFELPSIWNCVCFWEVGEHFTWFLQDVNQKDQLIYSLQFQKVVSIHIWRFPGEFEQIQFVQGHSLQRHFDWEAQKCLAYRTRSEKIVQTFHSLLVYSYLLIIILLFNPSCSQ